MMKLIIPLFFLMLFTIPGVGQTKLTGQNKENIIKKINNGTSVVKTLKCDFVQIKKMKLLKREMKSNGEMYYASNNKLRWQYNVPYKYVFIMNDKEIIIKSSRNKQKIDVQHNKMFQQISDIVLNCITGGHLRNSTEFVLDIYKNNNKYFARLYPKKKDLRKLYEYIDISFDPSLTMVDTVTMKEKTGDVTVVSLMNIIINKPINEKVFSID